MRYSTSVCRTLVIAALCCAAAPSQATIAVYTTEASFRAASGGSYVDDFSDLTIGTLAPRATSLQRSAGDLTYTIGDNWYMGVGSANGNPFISSIYSSTEISINNLPSNVTAVGGRFFGSIYNNGQAIDAPGSVQVYAFENLVASGPGTYTASDVAARTVTSTGDNDSSFLGFVSTGVKGIGFEDPANITSLSIRPARGTSDIHFANSVDDLMLVTDGLIGVPVEPLIPVTHRQLNNGFVKLGNVDLPQPDNNGFFNLDNVKLLQPDNNVPEPGSMALVALGLGILSFSARRKLAE